MNRLRLYKTQLQNFIFRNRMDIAISFIVIGTLSILVMLSFAAERQHELQETIREQNELILAQNELIRAQNEEGASRSKEQQRLLRCIAEYFATQREDRGAVLEDLDTCAIRRIDTPQPEPQTIIERETIREVEKEPESEPQDTHPGRGRNR